MSTGIDTTAVRRYKQGVEIRTVPDRGGTWKIWSGVSDHSALINGQTVQISGSTVFSDVSQLPPTSYLQFSGSSALKDQRSGGVTLADFRSPSGWIEPLRIRPDILLLQATQLVRPNIPRGYICWGSPVYDDPRGGSTPIVSLYSPQDGVLRPYIEDKGVNTDSIRPMILGRFGSCSPFGDVTPVAGIFVSGSNPEITAALSNMRPVDTEQFLPVGMKRGSGGYNFTDSIAFGDLTY